MTSRYLCEGRAHYFVSSLLCFPPSYDLLFLFYNYSISSFNSSSFTTLLTNEVKCKNLEDSWQTWSLLTVRNTKDIIEKSFVEHKTFYPPIITSFSIWITVNLLSGFGEKLTLTVRHQFYFKALQIKDGKHRIDSTLGQRMRNVQANNHGSPSR